MKKFLTYTAMVLMMAQVSLNANAAPEGKDKDGRAEDARATESREAREARKAKEAREERDRDVRLGVVLGVSAKDAKSAYDRARSIVENSGLGRSLRSGETRELAEKVASILVSGDKNKISLLEKVLSSDRNSARDAELGKKVISLLDSGRKMDGTYNMIIEDALSKPESYKAMKRVLDRALEKLAADKNLSIDDAFADAAVELLKIKKEDLLNCKIA